MPVGLSSRSPFMAADKMCKMQARMIHLLEFSGRSGFSRRQNY